MVRDGFKQRSRKFKELHDKITQSHLDYLELEEELEVFVKYVQEICALIYYQSALKDQDRWLEDKIVKGIFIPDTGEEE